MFKKRSTKNIFNFFFCFLFSIAATAGELGASSLGSAASPTQAAPVPRTATVKSSLSAAPSVQATANTQLNTAKTNSNDQAKKAGDSASDGGMMAGIMGAVCAAIAAYHFAAAPPLAASGNEPAAAAETNLGILFAAGAVLGILVAMNMGKGKKAADDSRGDLTAGVPVMPTTAGDIANRPESVGDMPAEVAAQVDAAKKALDKAGIKYDLSKGTFTTPNGKSYDANQVAAGTAGLPGGAAAFNNMMDQVKKDAEKKMADMGKNINDGQELGGGGGGSRVVTLPADESASPTNVSSDKKDRKPSGVEGAGKLYNGEMIGVAADGIFNIVCRRTVVEVEKGKTLEGAVGRKPGDCDRSFATTAELKK